MVVVVVVDVVVSVVVVVVVVVVAVVVVVVVVGPRRPMRKGSGCSRRRSYIGMGMRCAHDPEAQFTA